MLIKWGEEFEQNRLLYVRLDDNAFKCDFVIDACHE